MSLTVDIWSDVACPWCLIGKRRFDAALAAFPHRDQVTVTYRSFVLDPDLPARFDGTEEEYLSQRKGIPVAQARQMMQHVSTQAASEGLTYDWHNFVVSTSLPALRLLQAAGRLDASDRSRGVQSTLKDALLTARFERGLDIADAAVLRAEALRAGMTEAEVTSAFADDSLSDAVQADLAQARAYGISGVPFYVLGERFGVSGAQPTSVFADALASAWSQLNPLVSLDIQHGDACGPDGC